jgi:hypothetical protein
VTAEFNTASFLLNPTTFIPDSVCQSAIVYSYLAGETGEQQYSDVVVVLRTSLEFFDWRWKAAGELT